MQQILLKTACDELRKKMVAEFECSAFETSVTEPQGKVDTRTWKRMCSSKEEPRTNTMSNCGGSSRGTSKKHFPKQTRDQSNSRAASRGDHPPLAKRSKRGSSNQSKGNPPRNTFYRQEISPPRTVRCRHCKKACDCYQYFWSGCGTTPK